MWVPHSRDFMLQTMEDESICLKKDASEQKRRKACDVSCEDVCNSTESHKMVAKQGLIYTTDNKCLNVL